MPQANPKTAFIELMLAQQVLQFGDFTLNSGRISPYFFNMGEVNEGGAFADLGRAYADAIIAQELVFDVLFGPAYKGIPIATATAIALADSGMSVGVAYNRKEAKDHGEGGARVGAPINGRVLILDDVITAGTAIRGAIDIIQRAGGKPAGILIALDRQERGTGELSAVQEVQQHFGIPVVSILQLDDLIDHLETSEEYGGHLGEIQAYRERYGIQTRAQAPA